MAKSPDSSTHYTLGIIEVPEHATEMTHSRVKTTIKFLQCTERIHGARVIAPLMVGFFKKCGDNAIDLHVQTKVYTSR